MVRNSIILVDFIELRLAEGMPLDQAVVDAGAVRFRPMLLTAMAVVVGASVILADPIFQGLAISLMAGEIASLLISRMAVPVLYFMAYNRKPGATGPARLPGPGPSSKVRPPPPAESGQRQPSLKPPRAIYKHVPEPTRSHLLPHVDGIDIESNARMDQPVAAWSVFFMRRPPWSMPTPR